MIKLKIQSKSRDNALDAIKTAVSFEIKRLEIGLLKTGRQIEKFEKKYGVSSAVFLRRFTAEDLKGGDREFVEWMGELKLRERIARDLKKLKAIKYVA
jgi:hypothetical protein